MADTVNSITFDKWFEMSVLDFNQTCHLTKDEAEEISQIFDHFTLSPNHLYYDEVNQKIYPIESKSRLCPPTVDGIKEEILSYREKYDKLILYSIQLLTRTDSIQLITEIVSTSHQFYEVRFAVFPDGSIWHRP